MSEGRAVTVTEAVTSRLSVRAFLDRPVDPDLVRDVLEKASRAPSGGNLQPWQVTVIAGDRLEEFLGVMRERLAEPGGSDGAPYDIYPREPVEPYSQRTFDVGEAMYATIGIAREDKPARRRWFARNFAFFGAPVGMFCHIHRKMGPPQWSDLGMFLQTLMLLLVERGLGSCAQESWALYAPTVDRFFGIDPDFMLFTGMAIGYPDEDAPINTLRTSRVPLPEFARFEGL